MGLLLVRRRDHDGAVAPAAVDAVDDALGAARPVPAVAPIAGTPWRSSSGFRFHASI